jgi:uncharacterized repeat protein (TIGR03803 family)
MKEGRNLFSGARAALALAIIVFASVAATVAHAQTYTVLYNFGGDPQGPAGPYYGPVAQGRDGNLYATSAYGGSIGNCGAVFKITTAGTLTVLYNLGGDAGCTPFGGLSLGRDGNFYGTTYTTETGGAGTIFQVTPAGELGVLYSFSLSDMIGSHPSAPPVQGADGYLYGTTYGNLDPTYGTIYKISTPRHLTKLYEFTGHGDSAYPSDPLLQASDGNFYGTTVTSAFKISQAGAFTTLGFLPGDSYAPLIQASDGHFYGVTWIGGSHGNGTVFELSNTGKTRVLHNFGSAGDGTWPFAGLVQATDGNFYGTTAYGGVGDAGTIYRISPTGDFSVLHTFDQVNGSRPVTTLVQHTNGILYGTTHLGGPYEGGTFFSLDIGAAPFIRLVTTFGKVGRTIGILGQGFTGTTDVSFNGLPAAFTVSSDTYLEATVPTGATTGFVTVTTSTGTLTSNQQIQIRQ